MKCVPVNTASFFTPNSWSVVKKMQPIITHGDITQSVERLLNWSSTPSGNWSVNYYWFFYSLIMSFFIAAVISVHFVFCRYRYNHPFIIEYGRIIFWIKNYCRLGANYSVLVGGMSLSSNIIHITSVIIMAWNGEHRAFLIKTCL